MFLQKKHVTSNASRNLVSWTSKWYDRSLPTALSFRKKSLSGRSSLTGRIVVRTKSSLLRRVKLYKINYNHRLANAGVVTTFKLVPFSNKLLLLVLFSSGEYSLFPSITGSTIFSLLTFRHQKRSLSSTRKTAYHSFVYRMRTFRKISNLEIYPGKGIQYVRSAGCSAKITKRDLNRHTALVMLPSGVRKFFSFYSTLLLGPCSLKLKRKLANTKSGYWRSYGVKPIVRGVARNPVDHPHGGRTKSIKYPRTPWGKTTKFK